MAQQLGALLQAQQMMQQNMLEMMNHFASVEKSDKSDKKKMEQLDWRAMGEVQQFKGGESEWVDWLSLSPFLIFYLVVFCAVCLSRCRRPSSA